MNLSRAAEGLQVAALGPAKAGAGKNRQGDERGSLQPPANRTVAMMGFHRRLRQLELVLSAKACAVDLFEIRHDLSSLLGCIPSQLRRIGQAVFDYAFMEPPEAKKTERAVHERPLRRGQTKNSRAPEAA